MLAHIWDFILGYGLLGGFLALLAGEIVDARRRRRDTRKGGRSS